MAKEAPIDLTKFCDRYPQKRAFITGVGSGLGLAFALELAKYGWKIGAGDFNETTLAAAAEQIKQAGGTVETYKFDVAKYDDFKKAVGIFVEKFGSIDFGINNAGIGGGGFVDELPIEDFRRIVDINLMGVVNGCYLFAPLMKSQGFGHILNVASAAAIAQAPRMLAYNVSKAGCLAVSETLRGELHDYGVSVSVLMPTYIRTNIGRDVLGSDEAQVRAEILVERSEISPQQAVRETLMKVQNDDLYILLPEEARSLWRFKRFFPNQFWRTVLKETKRREEKLAKEIEKRLAQKTAR